MRSRGWVAVVVLAAACSSSGSDAAPDDTEPPPPQEVTLSPRDRVAVEPVAGGTVVWGGQRPWDGPGLPDDGEYGEVFLDDGAVIAKGATGADIPPTPLTAALRGPEAAAVGDLVVVVGETCAEAADTDGADWQCRPEPELAAAAYEPSTRRWWALDPPDDAASERSHSWIIGATDDEVIVGLEGWPRTTWAVDPVADRWRELTPTSYDREPCVAGGRVVRLEGDRRLGVLDLADVSSGFVRSAEAPAPWDDDASVPTLTCAGDRAVVTSTGDPETTVAPQVLDLTSGEWIVGTPSPPLPYRMSVARTLWTGADVLLLDTNPAATALAYDPAADAWRLPGAPGFDTRAAEWDGEAVVTWDRDTLRRWVLPES